MASTFTPHVGDSIMDQQVTITAITKNMDLCYSPDDHALDGAGWYLQKYPSLLTSQLFETKEELIEVYRKNPEYLRWD
jgi:hypothetical protein